MIYEGAPNWAETDAVVTIQTIPGQPTLEIRVDSHRNDQRMCALAMLENQGGNIKVTKLVEYFADHRVLGPGLRLWTALGGWFQGLDFSTRCNNSEEYPHGS
jgi:uncharacterized protein involved in tellurium resistance